MTNILIVEDYPVVSFGTRELILQSGLSAMVRICDTADEARQAIDELGACWHLILLDLDVPGAVGLSFAMELKDRGLAGVTCIWTGNGCLNYMATAKAEGFLGYLLKATAIEQLGSLAQRLLAGERFFSEPRVNEMESSNVRLTSRQLEAIRLVGEGNTTKEIAKAMGLSPGTVTMHIQNAMFILNAASRSQAIHRAFELGLLRPSNAGDHL